MPINLVLGKTGVTQGLSIYKGTLASPFDGSTGTDMTTDNKTLICSGGSVNVPVISLDLGQATILSKIVLKHAGGSATTSWNTMHIKNFKIQANNTNATTSATWVDVFSGTTSSSAFGTIDTFELNLSTAYRYYRIYSINNWGYSVTYVSIGELEMYASSYLIKQGADYYTIKTDKYDEVTTHNFIPLTLSGSTPTTNELNLNGFPYLPVLFASMTKGSDTFKPIEKFNSIQIISDTNQQYKALGIKSTSELIVSNELISTSQATAITKFFTENTLLNNGNIKIVISNDNMATWKAWNGSAWINLINTVVDKSYESMTTNEKTQWDTFKSEIISSGMTEMVLESADFNSFLNQNLRFAFVIIKPTYLDISTLKNLQWTYTGKDTWMLLSNDNDITVSVNKEFIKLTPIRDINSTVKENILT